MLSCLQELATSAAAIPVFPNNRLSQLAARCHLKPVNVLYCRQEHLERGIGFFKTFQIKTDII